MIGPDSDAIAESMRKARRRGDTLLAVDALEVAHVSHIAEETGLTAARVGWIMHGRLPYYRNDRSLVGLGLVGVVPRKRGRCYAITPLGRRVARILADERRVRHRSQHARLLHVKRRRLRG